MKNLELLTRTAVGGDEDGTSDAFCLTFDIESGTAFVATSREVVAVNRQSGEVSSRVSIFLDDENNCDMVPVGLEYLFDQQAVCVATSDGRLNLWQYEMNSTDIEVVGEVSQGITAMSWSPDFELLLIATGDKKLLMMTSEFDVLTEMSMFPDDQGEDSNIAVGWGKKETQFHGSAGKQAAKVQQVEVSPSSDLDDKRPQISWRADGQFFAVSAIEPDSGGRFIYTWSRECVFQARSEAVDGLQHSLCWKPSGSLIASVQFNCYNNSKDVVFFEKNGLRHGEFRVNSYTEADFHVHQLTWNQESNIMALHIDHYSGKQRLEQSCIQLWSVNNYHWYLKQTLVFEKGVAVVRWDPEDAYLLHLVTRQGQLVSYRWAWTTHCTTGATANDQATVIVIDGDKLLITPFRKMLVPPPMAAFTVTCSSPVNGITLSPASGSNDFMAYLSEGKLAFYSFQDPTQGIEDLPASGDGFKPICAGPTLRQTYRSVKNSCSEEIGRFYMASASNSLVSISMETTDFERTSLSHFLWISEDKIIMITQGESSSTSILLVGQVIHAEDRIVVNDKLNVSSVVMSMAFNQNTKNVVIELVNGELLKFMPESQTLFPWMDSLGYQVKFPSPCTQISTAVVGGEEVVLGLTKRFRFFVNDVEVASNCTSFAIHNDFLLLTTLSHTLRCLPTTLKVSELPKLSAEKEHPFDERSRRVERGSCIVSVVGDGTQVVLQMPRGNLETIHPRALILCSLKRLLDSDQIQEAFMIIRKHRINMNLIHDHNPKHFLENVDKFIKAVDNQSYLNVFLTDLIEEDVTDTMYKTSYPEKSGVDQKLHLNGGSKVDAICDAFLEAFKRLGLNQYIQSVLTAYARKTQPELEKALLLVWSLHDNEGNTHAEAALSYLLFLVEVNELYDIALGTYNFDLVMMVAQKSQKDPKEYIPFLNQLRRLEENYRYFTIDKFLKKSSKALEHISKCGDEHFDECVTLVTEHKLYAQALSLYKPGTSQFKQMATLYGNYLSSKNRHDEAGIHFVKAEEWEMALDSFHKAHDWQQVFSMAHRLQYNIAQQNELAVKVAGDLKGRQRYEEASRVLTEYAQDHEEAIVALIEGCHWREALRLMHKFQRLDLVETHLLDALQESWENHIEMLTSQRTQFERHKVRIQTVRAQKEKAAAELLDGTGDYNDAEADLFSDTTSMTGASVSSLVSSNSSRSTVFTKGSGSSRTRRKADNKKWSLKEGSPNEEFALVDAEAKIIKSVDGIKEDIGQLLRILIQFNFDKKAAELQEMYSSFLHYLRSSISEIWTYTQKPLTSSMNLGPNMTSNAVTKALQTGQYLQGQEEQLDPVLLAPPTLDKDTRWKLHTSGDQER